MRLRAHHRTAVGFLSLEIVVISPFTIAPVLIDASVHRVNRYFGLCHTTDNGLPSSCEVTWDVRFQGRQEVDTLVREDYGFRLKGDPRNTEIRSSRSARTKADVRKDNLIVRLDSKFLYMCRYRQSECWFVLCAGVLRVERPTGLLLHES